jgi:hypothetical protein
VSLFKRKAPAIVMVMMTAMTLIMKTMITVIMMRRDDGDFDNDDYDHSKLTFHTFRRIYLDQP